eukprot:3199490-Pyramimonas_sp.AAC.1
MAQKDEVPQLTSPPRMFSNSIVGTPLVAFVGASWAILVPYSALLGHILGLVCVILRLPTSMGSEKAIMTTT